MQKYKAEYYKRPNGKEPAREWYKSRDGSIRQNIFKRLEVLKEEGLNLVKSHALYPIYGGDKVFYEFRNSTLNWRIGVYYDENINTFILLHGWSHDENHEIEHQKELDKARNLLHEYLTGRI